MPIFPQFENATLLVIGDSMVDRYWYGDTTRISPEAPVPVVNIKGDEYRPGGAANVALNIAKLGAKVSCLGFVGQDAEAQRLMTALSEASVHTAFTSLKHRATITKLRVVCRQQQLIRLDFEETHNTLEELAQLLTAFQKELPNANGVILSDYNKGSLQQAQQLIQMCRQANLPVFVDPKGQDFTQYKGATILTPNLSEFEAIVGPVTQDNIISKAQVLIQQLDLKALLVTRGSQGMSLIEANMTQAYHVPALTKEVFDVTGAGDTVIATLAAAYCSGQSLQDAVFMANLAASIVVSKLGTATASQAELRQLLEPPVLTTGIMSAEQLKKIVDTIQAVGETVVMTNGCFDLLHIGHLSYLKEARQLGDKLIVAVNTDESVQLLKGPDRPINSIDKRMAMLAALKDVDYVVAFNDATPQALIAFLLPDILVKGGDYQIADIAGHQEVLTNGGQVKILNFVQGESTTNTLKKIQQLAPQS